MRLRLLKPTSFRSNRFLIFSLTQSVTLRLFQAMVRRSVPPRIPLYIFLDKAVPEGIVFGPQRIRMKTADFRFGVFIPARQSAVFSPYDTSGDDGAGRHQAKGEDVE